jgi:hypothetical protein
MVATLEQDRNVLIRRSVGEAERWSDLVDTLLRAFHRRAGTPPSLGCKMEALRNKRDTVVTKVEALKRHRDSGWQSAQRELDSARRELRDAWRSVIGTLDKESLFV